MLADFCIYTIKHSSDLDKAYESGSGRGTFNEKTRWVSASHLLADAIRTGTRLPVVFCWAEETRDLRYWGLLEKVEVGSDGTAYTFSDLKPISPTQLKTALRKRSDRSRLDRYFIRPYAICYTPAFLEES
jgi:hypothetical protein